MCIFSIWCNLLSMGAEKGHFKSKYLSTYRQRNAIAVIKIRNVDVDIQWLQKVFILEQLPFLLISVYSVTVKMCFWKSIKNTVTHNICDGLSYNSKYKISRKHWLYGHRTTINMQEVEGWLVVAAVPSSRKLSCDFNLSLRTVTHLILPHTICTLHMKKVKCHHKYKNSLSLNKWCSS